MTLIINGQPEDQAAETLFDLVETLGLADAMVATALNGAFVPAAARRRTALTEGDRVEILAPMQGG
ncbi:sulfur carrier protein ThiS [Lichenifustis flavocetrariae]|uniref:Sulfur carrier protein ThiS n=1 Tax=Lichenifustis flavocetrariae TaxID=2949735 RepID=A0AA42CHM5_9HYPH|nr:sulfur carrier protein ThiS [Lichenifustis flavocetrariae]MCW6507698.1 sulfur carrier protein ThiS [Lichenifustis flavocetrariae]